MKVASIHHLHVQSQTSFHHFNEIGIFCEFLISAISIDPQISAKIKQPQKIPVIRYHFAKKEGTCLYLRSIGFTLVAKTRSSGWGGGIAGCGMCSPEEGGGYIHSLFTQTQ